MPVDYMEIIYRSLFALLAIGYILVKFVFKMDKKHPARDWITVGFEAMIIATLLRTFILQTFVVPTGSMEETIKIGDHPIALKYQYGIYNPFSDSLIFPFSEPQRGEVVIFRDPRPDSNIMMIKRVVGIPGDVIEIKLKQLFVNGKYPDETYKAHKDKRMLPGFVSYRDSFGPVTVPEGHYFVMGDNRDFSGDSRFFGFLPKKNLRGKAFFIYWPPKNIGSIKHRKDIFDF